MSGIRDWSALLLGSLVTSETHDAAWRAFDLHSAKMRKEQEASRLELIKVQSLREAEHKAANGESAIAEAKSKVDGAIMKVAELDRIIETTMETTQLQSAKFQALQYLYEAQKKLNDVTKEYDDKYFIVVGRASRVESEQELDEKIKARDLAYTDFMAFKAGSADGELVEQARLKVHDATNVVLRVKDIIETIKFTAKEETAKILIEKKQVGLSQSALCCCFAGLGGSQKAS
mgnify:CR=1 FL=1